MNRRLPNRANNYLGHSQVDAKVVTLEEPKTIARTIHSTGETELISEARAYSETFDSFRAANNSTPHSQVLRELLASGATLATPKAEYRSQK